MAVSALKRQPKLKTFHATMLVTRAEEWCVEAENAEEARRLLAGGEGHRCHLGDCVQLSSASRFSPGAFGFLLLIQCGERPELYCEILAL